MPFARWENLEECKLEQMQIGHSQEHAKNICEGIKEREDKGILFKAQPTLEILKSKDGELIIGGPASWEVEDYENDYVTTEGQVNFLRKFLNLPPEYRNISIDHTNFQMATALLQYPHDKAKYFSHVHEKGMYLVAKVRNDKLNRTQHYRQQIKDGSYKMFSISGEALRCDGPCDRAQRTEKIRKIYDIDPFEVAIVKEGMNPKAEFQILKGKNGLDKKIERRGDKWCLLHHTGSDAGKPIKCFDTKEEALAMHRAIMANKTVTKDERPPKTWWDNCISRAQSFADDPSKFCGDLWHNGPPEKRETFGKSLQKLTERQEVEKIFRKHFPEYKGDVNE